MLSRFLKAANATIFGQIIGRFGSFILVPIFLSHWTPAVYGEWLTLYAAVGYLSSLDVGMQAAALNRLTAAFARRDLIDYRKAQNSALAMYIVTAGFGLTILIAISATGPVGKLLGLRITSPHDAAVVLVLLGAWILLSMPGKIIIGSYQTMGNLARSQWVSNGQVLLNLTIMAGLLLLHHGMKALAAVPLITSFLAASLVFTHLKQSYPAITPSLSEANWQTIRSLMKPSLLFAVITVGMLLHYQAATLVISITLGGAAVSLFSVSRMLVVVLRAATDTIADSIAPDVCRLDAVQDRKRLGQLLELLLGLSVCIGVAGAAMLWWEGGSIISIWTRGRLVPDLLLIRLFLLVAIGQSVWVGLCVFGTATNRNRNVAIAILISNLLAIVISIALVHRLGAIAVPIGLILGEGIVCYHFLVRDTCRKCNVPYGPFAAKLWAFVVVASLAAIGAGYLLHLWVGERWFLFRWAIVGVTTFAISVAFSWMVWFRTEHRQLVRQKMIAMLGFHPTLPNVRIASTTDTGV